jgi:hypothetical protein
LAWTYMGMLIRDGAPVVPAAPAVLRPEKENEEPVAVAALLAEKDAEIARLQALVAQLRSEARSKTPPASPAFSLSPLSSPFS